MSSEGRRWTEPVPVPHGAPEPRPFCYRCFRPEPMCLCDHVAPVDNRTGVIVLQHVRERFHPFGSARLLQQGLARCQLHVAYRSGVSDKGVHCPVALPPDTALLYPRPDARLLSSLAPVDRPAHLLLLDGTWSQAHRLYRDNPWLQRLPHVALSPSAPSLYRVRREPKPHCLSTLEAAVQALTCLEPDTQGLDALLSLFVRMNDEQVSRRHSVLATPRKKRVRHRASRAIPDVLRDDPGCLVVVYGESAQLHTRSAATDPEPFQWVAARFDGTASFERFVKPAKGETDASHLRCMQLDASVCERAVGMHELRAAWSDFLRPNDVVVAWNSSSLRMHELIHDRWPASLLLKRAYTNVHQARPGTLDDVVQREGLSVPSPPTIAGRAGRRLANALAITGWLVQRAAR